MFVTDPAVLREALKVSRQKGHKTRSGHISRRLRQLASLTLFRRLMIATAAGNPPVEAAVEHVEQQCRDASQCVSTTATTPGQVNITDIPRALRSVHAGLCNHLDAGGNLVDPQTAPETVITALGIAQYGQGLTRLEHIRAGLVNAAVAALVGVISLDRQRAGE